MGVFKGRIATAEDRVYAVSGDSGEIIGEAQTDRNGAFVWIPSKVHYGKDYVVLFQSQLERMAHDDLQGNTMRVFLFLLANMEYGNECHLQQKEIAAALHMHPQYVSKALKTLIEKGYITRRDNIHYLSLESGWRGRIAAYHRAAKQQGA